MIHTQNSDCDTVGRFFRRQVWACHKPLEDKLGDLNAGPQYFIQFESMFDCLKNWETRVDSFREANAALWLYWENDGPKYIGLYEAWLLYPKPNQEPYEGALLNSTAFFEPPASCN